MKLATRPLRVINVSGLRRGTFRKEERDIEGCHKRALRAATVKTLSALEKHVSLLPVDDMF